MKQTIHPNAAWKHRALKRGNPRPLGPIERAKMTLAGRSDGKRSLPQPDERGGWSSPRIRAEQDGYEAFSARIWGTVQLELEPLHKEAGNLVSEIERLERELRQHLADTPDSPEPGFFSARRRGEEDLSEKQVAQRRRRELEKLRAPWVARKRALEHEISQSYERLNDLRSAIVETDNAARLICERTANRVRLRLDAYWNAAMRQHPRAGEMPDGPEATLQSAAEQTYLSQHAYLIETVTEMLRARAKMRAAEDEQRLEEIA